MRNPERFSTFVIGTVVFVYYIILALQITKVWKQLGHCPIPVFREGGIGNALHALLGFFGPLPILAWAWSPAAFSAARIACLDNWFARMAGLLALCLAVSVGYLSVFELGNSWRMGVETGAPPSLVRTGIYGSIRHPIYGSVMLGLLGVSLIASNLVFAAMFLSAVIGLLLLARREERFLSDRLGPDYADYRRSTGRFFP